MLRPIDHPPLLDPQTRPTVPAMPPSPGKTDTPPVSVGQAAVVELGSSARAADASAVLSNYKRSGTPYPGLVVSPAPATANAVTGTASDDYKSVRGADGMNYAVSGQVLVSPGTIHEDPAQAIRELTQIRQAALTPPTTPTDLELAARATLDVQRAQLELARKRYLQDASAEPAVQANPASPPTTDITA